MKVVVYFLLFYKFQLLLVHECQQKPIIIFSTLLWELFPNGSHCLVSILYTVQFLLVHECQQKLIIYFQHCSGDYSQMLDAAHPFCF